MRRFAIMAAPVVLIAGHIATGSPATASPERVNSAVGEVGVRQNAFSGTGFLAQVDRDRTQHATGNSSKIKCKSKDLKRYRRNTQTNRDLAWIWAKLRWCYDGEKVTSWEYERRWWTYNTDKLSWNGWTRDIHQLSANKKYFTLSVRGSFSGSDNHRDFKPWIYIRGGADGSLEWESGS